MVRLQQRAEVAYGHFGEFMNSLDEVNDALRSRGWAEFAPWAPLAGKVNEVVLFSDYPDLAAYKKEEAAFHADPEVMNLWRQAAQFVVQGSASFELLDPAPHLASKQ